MRDWERKRCPEYCLQRYGTRNSREKGAGIRNAGLGPPRPDPRVGGDSTIRTSGTSTSYASAHVKCLHFLGGMHFSDCISNLGGMYLRLRLRHQSVCLFSKRP